MAVPKRRLSKHRKRTRRAHHHYKKVELNRCSHCGQAVMPHRVCHNCGRYGGREVIATESF